jgi:hypothetical protein
MKRQDALDEANHLETEYVYKLRSCKEYKNFMRILRGNNAVRQEHIDAYASWKDSVFIEERKAMEDAYDRWEKITAQS